MATLKRKTNNGYEPLPAMVVRKTNAENGNGIGTCSTSSGTALEVVLSDYNLVQNGFIAVTFSNDVPANATLNINSKGAKPIYYKGSAIEADVIKADDTVMFCYNGSQYVVTSLGGGGAAPVNPNETVNISLTQIGGNSADLIGASVTITDDDSGDTLYTGTWAGTMLTTEIDVNTNYTVSVETVSGYLACPDQSYQAGYQTERNISFQYRGIGAYIEATDGTLYTSSTWASSGKTANAVVLLTSSFKKRIAIDPVTKPIHPNESNFNFGSTMTPISDITLAKSDMDGKGNTAKMIQYQQTVGTNTNSYAAPYCNNYTFPDGKSKGYLAAKGEWTIVYQNMQIVNACFTVLGVQTLANSYIPCYWTSTLNSIDSSNSRALFWVTYDGWGVSSGYSTSVSVLPFSDYE